MCIRDRTFTISLGVLGMILGAFIDQVPAAAFMLAFVNRIYQELGYTKEDSYPHITNIITCLLYTSARAMVSMLSATRSRDGKE